VDVIQSLARFRVIPVIVIDQPDHAVPLARALAEGGLPVAEVTFRTGTAAEALRRIAAECPDVLLGAGTVLDPDQAAWARAAGASFVVAPGLNPRVVDYCTVHGIPVIPGVATPTEIEAARERGLHVLKFFPAEAMGGQAYLKAVSAPYRDVQFIPTGGISAANLEGYLSMKNVLACGGSWMAPPEWIRDGEFDRIRDEAAKASAIARVRVAIPG
jgi:2-dehydro-3-deoxyphosphogluconate aldolase/(4S)-4-hydroxy-2-oxoglutarate aldolase